MPGLLTVSFASKGRPVKTVYNYAKMYYKDILIIRRGP